RNQSDSLSSIGWRRGLGGGGTSLQDYASPRSSPNSCVVGRGSKNRPPDSSQGANNFAYCDTGADAPAVVRSAIPVGFVLEEARGQSAGLRRGQEFQGGGTQLE